MNLYKIGFKIKTNYFLLIIIFLTVLLNVTDFTLNLLILFCLEEIEDRIENIKML